MAGTSLRPEVPVWYFCTLAMHTYNVYNGMNVHTIHIYDIIREANVDIMSSRGYIYTFYIYIYIFGCVLGCLFRCLPFWFLEML